MQVEDLSQGRSILDPLLPLNLLLSNSNLFHNLFHRFRINPSQTMKASLFLNNGAEFFDVLLLLG